ncbi:uncharacterized protein LOC129335290 [Eublepharis macularius]|uniref:Uncharacterized protein LOC129335290 n=1 Tax=Eublepharis macularius TaxID=481883 RepID=A0AA97JUR4_EUBMA|nr:uncharacterized protein LOC129335290 [Eublepharis macularius]
MAWLSPQCVTFPITADIHEQNVTFLICALERIPSKMSILKEILIKTLFSLASKPTDSMFSIVSCNNKVLKWQKTLVKCSLASVAEAAAWIRALKCENEASVSSAMAAALEDSSCQAVYLFTSGLPEWTAEEICGLLKEAGQARPLHTVYLVGSGKENKNSLQETLEKIAKESGGSFQMITYNSDETEDQINPEGTASIHHPDHISKHCCCSLPTDHHTTTCSPLGMWSLDSPPSLLRSTAKEDFVDQFPKTNDLQRGIRVLARKKTDGYFYLGCVVRHVKGSREHVLIVFERSKKSPNAKAECRTQETPLYDVIHHEDARWQPVAPGDRVLAPWEKKGERYGPGTVLQVTESASSHSAFKNSKVLVNFWNGQTKEVPSDKAVRIPLPLSERIVLELQMPLAARQTLVEQNPHYPYTVPPGYRASGSCQQNHLECICWSDALKVLHGSATCCSPHMPLCHFCFPAGDHIRSPITSPQLDGTLIPGTSMTKEELNRKIEEQLSRGRLPVLEGHENEGGRKLTEEKNLADLTYHKESESKVTLPNQSHQKERALEDLREGTGTTVDVAVNTDKCIPWQTQKAFPQSDMNETSARPSHQSPPRKRFVADTLPVHAAFEWADQSLKEDSSAIESILHMRRSYSAPAIQRPAAKLASPDSQRETARIEFKRHMWEQRQLKEEQKQQEERMRKELLRDKKRHQLLQRSWHLSAKQQQNSEKTLQRLGQLQVARAERIRQESCLQEEAENRESQRLEFLKAQCRQRDKQLTEHNQSVDDHKNKRLELLRNRMQFVQKNLKAAEKEQDTKEKERAAAKWRELQKRELTSQRVEKKRQETLDLQRYLREQSLLMLRASLLS